MLDPVFSVAQYGENVSSFVVATGMATQTAQKCFKNIFI